MDSAEQGVRDVYGPRLGFDKPLHERFLTMIGGYLTLDFGTSFYQDRPVLELLLERLPVSISLGLWSMLLSYLISVPLGVRKAVKDGTRFDVWSSAVLFVGYAVPGFLLAIVLIKQFVLTARAKGLAESRVLYGHVFRNAMLIVIAGFPAALIGILFTGSMLIEVIFSLDGIGLLGFEAVISRDYPIKFGTLFIFTIIGLMLQLVGDITYTLVDPRIDFEARS